MDTNKWTVSKENKLNNLGFKCMCYVCISISVNVTTEYIKINQIVTRSFLNVSVLE